MSIMKLWDTAGTHEDFHDTEKYGRMAARLDVDTGGGLGT